MRKLIITLSFFLFVLLLSSCGGEEIDACVGAASDPDTYVTDCSDCCQDNGYKRGIVSTSGSDRTCKCSGDPD